MVTALLQMGDMSKSIQPLVIDASFSFILWGDKFLQHISKLPYVVCWLNTGLHLIWLKYQHSYVDFQCFRFYLREVPALIIIFKSMQHVSTQLYKVGCSARWSYFNWGWMSTLKIIR